VAVLVDGITSTGVDGQEQWTARPVEELKALRDLVTAAVGYDESRGDVVTVESMQFRADATPGTLVDVPSWQRLLESNAMMLIQIAVLATVVIVLALTVVRPLLSRPASAAPGAPARVDGAIEGASGSAPALGRPLGQSNEGGNLPPAPGLPVLAAPSRSNPSDLAPATSSEALRLAITEQPDQAAMMIREWLATDEGEAA